MSILGAFLTWHRFHTNHNPYTVNAVQSTLLMALGDTIAQHLEADGARYSETDPLPEFDGYRLLALTTWAGCINAPFWTWWYKALEKRWPSGRVLGWVLSSAALSPPWNAAFFCWSTTASHLLKENGGLGEAGLHELQRKCAKKLDDQLVPTVSKSVCLWVPFNIINFSLVPLNYRMLSGGITALAWNVFLSSVQARGSPQSKENNLK